LQIPAEDRIADIPNDALSSFCVHDTSKMGIKDSSVFVVLSVNLKEMSTEILDDSFVVIGTIAKRSDVFLDSQAIV